MDSLLYLGLQSTTLTPVTIELLTITQSIIKLCLVLRLVYVGIYTFILCAVWSFLT